MMPKPFCDVIQKNLLQGQTLSHCLGFHKSERQESFRIVGRRRIMMNIIIHPTCGDGDIRVNFDQAGGSRMGFRSAGIVVMDIMIYHFHKDC